MRVYTITELLRMTKTELCFLLREAEIIIKDQSASETEQAQARTNIVFIRCALLRQCHNFSP